MLKLRLAVCVITCMYTFAAATAAGVRQRLAAPAGNNPTLHSSSTRTPLRGVLSRSVPHHNWHPVSHRQRLPSRHRRGGNGRSPLAQRRPFRPRVSLPRQHASFNSAGPRQQGGKSHSLSLQQIDNGPIRYHGGRVVTGSRIDASSTQPPAVQVYLLYYGSWSDVGQRGMLEAFVNSLSATEGTLGSWWNISAPYYQISGDGSASFVASQVALAGTHIDAYSRGAGPFFSGDTSSMLSPHIGPGKAFPYDSTAIYFLLTSSDIVVDGLCTSYCGFHWFGSLSDGSAFTYAYVGMPGQCLYACAPQSTSPNGDAAMDALISVFAHELTEAASDPDVNAWYTDIGNENADLCGWNFLNTAYDSGYFYNHVGVGGERYLVQANWDLALQQCVNGNTGDAPVTPGVSPPPYDTPSYNPSPPLPPAPPPVAVAPRAPHHPPPPRPPSRRPPPPQPWWCRKPMLKLIMVLMFPDLKC